ncbi:hypothetical protein AB0B63_07100 [Micromonospora sp. NPDC049081]|uniref:hypothetical protein n=1 Tax=Micromonospora sp. NPDC049081 TaxID=3155150 RepID=UPI0033C00949
MKNSTAHATVFEIIDVDTAIRAAGGDPLMEDALEVLGEPDGFGGVSYSGPWRRLKATLTSLDNRAPENVSVAVQRGEKVSNPYTDDARYHRVQFSMDSHAGCWSSRAWAVTGTLKVNVDSWLDGNTSVADVEVIAVGSTGGATRFTGRALCQFVRSVLMERIAKAMVLNMVGEDYWIGDKPIQLSEGWPHRWVKDRMAIDC